MFRRQSGYRIFLYRKAVAKVTMAALFWLWSLWQRERVFSVR